MTICTGNSTDLSPNEITVLLEIREGLFSLPRRTVISFGDRSVELPVQMVMPVGDEMPIIQVS